jgi:flagellar biosynthesis/type III secretory pathway chaperone
MKMDNPAALVPKLIDALRQELQEYGEMLALLDQQQQAVITRAADNVLQSTVGINEQMQKIRTVREDRERGQQILAQLLKVPEAFASLVPALPEKFRLAVQTLVRENNQLLSRVQQRARQNHLLLGRSLELMQEFLNTLLSVAAPLTYDGAGHAKTGAPVATGIYEAVG